VKDARAGWENVLVVTSAIKAIGRDNYLLRAARRSCQGSRTAIRGTAGGSIYNAELLVQEGLL
jgi:hypothetical protein